jgi:MYXO-CTERM domain-containing protein
VKRVLTLIGLFLLLGGLLWIGQGTGLVDWPRSSFMIDQRPWIFRGALLALAGVVLIWLSRRR